MRPKQFYLLESQRYRRIGLGLLMTVFTPAAHSATISITTSVASGTLGDANNSFVFTGANIASLGSVPVLLSGTSLSTSFGEFIDAVPGSASNSSVIDILLHANVNGSLGTLDFKGTLSKLGSAYLLNFTVYAAANAVIERPLGSSRWREFAITSPAYRKGHS